ncbi:MAG: uroporphyrinogen decarboxylase family protein [bacterium]
MANVTSGTLEQLLQQYLAICDSASNRRNAAYWAKANDSWLIERWRGISARKTDAPFTIALDMAGYAKVLGIDCKAYYTNVTAHLHEQLRYQIWEFEQLKSNRFFEKTAFVSFGACYSASLFGAEIVFPDGQAPWVNLHDPLIKEYRDLNRLNTIELDRHGLGPRAHEFYLQMRERLQGTGIKVNYPSVIRGPFSVATQLRETTRLLMDMLDEPSFVHDLMRRITDGLKRHAQLRAAFTGEPVAPGKLFNDEIATPMISRWLYEEFILPYELELAAFHGRIHYWHSCGITQDFYESVRTLPGLEMMHIGPWSDLAKAAEVFSSTNMALDICLSATGDVYDRTAEEMRQKLQGIKDTCDGRVKYAVRADGFQIVRTVEEDLAKIRLWNQMAAEVFGQGQRPGFISA